MGTNSKTYLRIKDLSKQYNDVHALSNFSLEVQQGEFIALVGPSGCGKSTTLRLLAGLEFPDSGTIYLDGVDITRSSAASRNIAMVFQNFALYPHLTVYGNLAFPLKIRGMKKGDIEEKVIRTAKIVGISNLLQRKPRELSGGQQQRVAIGRALVRNPKLFLMDEPLSNLDAQLRSQMRTELLKLHHETESTIIYVTHDQTEALTLASTVVILKGGIAQQSGSPQSLYRNPDNMFVASFIGTPTMNFIPCRATDKGVVLNEAACIRWHQTPPDWRSRMSERKQMILGVRSESVHALPQNPASKASRPLAKALFKRIEFTGADSYIIADSIGVQLTIKLPTSTTLGLRPGDEFAIEFCLNEASIFDASSRLRIC